MATYLTSNIFSDVNITGNCIVSGSFNQAMFRNKIYNGNFQIWQRATTSTSTAASAYSTADRWCGAISTSGLTLAQSATVPSGAGFNYSLQVATSTGTASTPLIEQRIEQVNVSELVNGTPITVSFWASQTAGTLMPLSVSLLYPTVKDTFSTQTIAVAAAISTATLTGTMAYYTVKFVLNTGFVATNGLCLRFTTGATASTGTFLITGVQLEKGFVATPFEFRPYGAELALCQRYYFQLTTGSATELGVINAKGVFGTGTGVTTTSFWLPIKLPVPMRSPRYTVTTSAVGNFQLLPQGTTTITAVGTQTDSYTPMTATVNFTGTNIVAGSSYIVRTVDLTTTATAFIGVSAEL
jgi:hypothetical protein